VLAVGADSPLQPELPLVLLRQSSVRLLATEGTRHILTKSSAASESTSTFCQTC